MTSTQIDISQEFYLNLFGWKSEPIEIAEAPGYLVMRSGNQIMAGVDPIDKSKGPAVWTIFVSTTDLRATAQSIETHGGAMTIPPAQVLNLGRMAMARDPEGTVFGLWEPQEYSPADIPIVEGKLVGARLATVDPESASRFYVEAFGWDSRDEDDGSVTMQCGGMVAHVQKDLQANVWTPTVAVADVRTSCRRVAELGGSVLTGEAEDEPLVADPLGALFRLRTVAMVGGT
ncbi:VOC family protein [Rhodococcus sp. IC4_135]|nr:VOC family protein [Rhodococcus sp. IC4_135]